MTNKEELQQALAALKAKGGKHEKAAIKLEIMAEYSESMAEVLAKGEFWRIETVIGVYEERLRAAMMAFALKDFLPGGPASENNISLIKPRLLEDTYAVRNLDITK